MSDSTISSSFSELIFVEYEILCNVEGLFRREDIVLEDDDDVEEKDFSVWTLEEEGGGCSIFFSVVDPAGFASVVDMLMFSHDLEYLAHSKEQYQFVTSYMFS